MMRRRAFMPARKNHGGFSMSSYPLSRRSFLALSAMLPWAWQARASTSIPVGLELYSVRSELKRDPEATVRAVGEIGYQCVEFDAPYFQRTAAQTTAMRRSI